MERFWQLFMQLVMEQTEGVSYRMLIITIIIGVILVHICCNIYQKRTGNAISIKKEVLYMCVVAYACVLFQLTLFRREADSRGGVFLDLNLGALTGDNTSLRQLGYSILNVAMFMPWGFFVALSRKMDGPVKRIIMSLLICFMSSFMIEVLQLITKRGYFELNDLVTNVIGGLIGIILATIIIFIHAYISDGGIHEESE